MAGTTVSDFRTHRFHVLDGMRGIAALLVMCHHCFFTRQLSYLSNTFVAVDFFFILSGFVISHAYGEKIRADMKPTDYLARRVTRLFPMMALGLLIGAPILYLMSAAGHATFGKRDILASLATNLMFLPSFTDKAIVDGSGLTHFLFAIDPPLWSIFFEMAASLFFLMLIRLRPSGLIGVTIASFVLVCATVFVYGFTSFAGALMPNLGVMRDTLLGGFPRVLYGFTCGMALYQAASSRSAVHKSALWTIGLYLAVIATLLFPFAWGGASYLATIAVIAPLIIRHGAATQIENRLLLVSAEYLGWLSFPLYCVHQPVLDAIRLLDDRTHFAGRCAVPVDAVSIFACLTTATICALFVDRILQKPFGRLVNRLASAASSSLS